MRSLFSLLLVGVAVSAQAGTVDLARPDAVRLTPKGATLDPTVRKAADGGELVAVTFPPSPSPSLVIAPKQGTWAWPANGAMRLRVQNGMPWPVTLIVDIASNGKPTTPTVGVPPGPPQTLSVSLKP